MVALSLTGICETAQQTANWLRGRKRKLSDCQSDQNGDHKEIKVPRVSNNPFETSGIISKVLSYVDGSTLRNARLVSKSWAEAGLKHLLAQSYLPLPAPANSKTHSPSYWRWNPLVGKEQKFQLFLKSVLSSDHKDVETINLRIVEPKGALNVLEEIDFKNKALNKQVRGLKYEGPADSMTSLNQLLEKFPNLVSVDTSALDLSPAQFAVQNENDQSKFWKFLRRLSVLQDLKISGIAVRLDLK